MEKVDPRDTIFAKIVAGTIPSKKVYEDDQVLAIHDVNPQAPVHVLLLPKKPIGGIGDATDDDRAMLGHLFASAPKIAKQLNLDQNGYRLVVNEGTHGQQSVRWLHVHLIGGRQLTWPPG